MGGSPAPSIATLLDGWFPWSSTLAGVIGGAVVPSLGWFMSARLQWRKDQREGRESIVSLMGRLADQQRAELVRQVAEADALRKQLDLFSEGRYQLQQTLDDLREQMIAARVLIHDYERRLRPETSFPPLPLPTRISHT